MPTATSSTSVHGSRLTANCNPARAQPPKVKHLPRLAAALAKAVAKATELGLIPANDGTSDERSGTPTPSETFSLQCAGKASGPLGAALDLCYVA